MAVIVLPLKVTLRLVALKMVFFEFESKGYAEILVEMRLLAEEDREVVETDHSVLEWRERKADYVVVAGEVGFKENLDSFLE